MFQTTTVNEQVDVTVGQEQQSNYELVKGFIHFVNCSLIAPCYFYSIGSKVPYTDVSPCLRYIFRYVLYPWEQKLIPDWEIAIKTILYIVAMLIALVGNVCVLVTVIRSSRMHSPTYFFLANLSISDLLIVAFCMWPHLGSSINNDWLYGDVMCVLYHGIQSKYISILFNFKIWY